MKKIFIFLFSLLYLSLFSQCLPGPGDLPPTVLSELEAKNRCIAEHFAPIVHQQAFGAFDNSVNGRADLILAVDYDGDLNAGNNWESLENFGDPDIETEDVDALDPVVYYSVVWLENYFLVTYAFYHARDYTYVEVSPNPFTNECCRDNHEMIWKG